jgi:hypothetical protein
MVKLSIQNAHNLVNMQTNVVTVTASDEIINGWVFLLFTEV